MPSEFAAGQREVRRVERNLQTRIFRSRRQLPARQEDVAAHLAAERHIRGWRARPVLRRVAGGPQPTVYGVPAKIEPLPLMCQPSRIAFPTGWFNKFRLTSGMS